MIPQNVKDYFSRHFLGKVNVNCLPQAMDAPRVSSIKRAVETHPIRTRMKVAGSVFFAHKTLACSSRGFRFSSQIVKVKGSKITAYAPGEIKTRSIPKLKLKTRAREDTKRVAVLPQERSNRMQWLSARPKKSGEFVLAWFGPIVEDAIVKLTLNKQQGTLLIWYNPQSRRFDAKSIYLCKRFGVRGDPEWRWV